jgi:hypothetical protein
MDVDQVVRKKNNQVSRLAWREMLTLMECQDR